MLSNMLGRIKMVLRALLRRSRAECELDEELRYHIERQTEQNIRLGMSPEEAHDAARKAFGGVEQAKERSRDARGVRWLEDLLQDLRYGARMLMKSPGFTFIAALTLALGIGANTAVFSLVDAFMLRLLPVKDPEQLVFVKAISPQGRMTGGFSYGIFEQFRDRSRSFSGIFAYDMTRFSATARGQPEMISGDFVSGGYFDVLGVSALRGRTFTAADDQPGKEPVAVISCGYWERRFGSDPEAVGQTIYVGKLPVTVIGVTPPEFFGRQVAGAPPEIVLPMFLHEQLALRDHNTFAVMARLKPGVSIEQARAELDVIYHQVLRQEAGAQPHARAEQELRARRIELRSGLRGELEFGSNDRLRVRIVLAIVGLVLLIACVNVANLLLARASVRQKEIAVRLSLGAGRWRLVRQLLTESVLLALLAGALGLLLAHWLVDIFFKVLPFYGGDTTAFNIDLRILAFTGVVSLLVGVLFGLIPALLATRIDLNQMLKGAEGRTASRRARQRLAKSLVIAQVALSLALLLGAGLLIRSLRQVYAVDVGFDRDKVLHMWVYPTLLGYDYEREMRLYSALLERFRAQPGVASASLSRYNLPKDGNFVGPGFFETLGLGMARGREFSAADTATSPKVAIINEVTAQRYFPNANPVGQPLPEELRRQGRLGRDVQIVGVARSFKRYLRQERPGDGIFIPYTQAPPESLGQIVFYVRATGDPVSLIPALRQQARAVEPDLVLLNPQTITAILEYDESDERALAALLSFFGALALALAGIGLYGTMSYAVSRRTTELGIRMALGAQKRDVLWLVLREALWQVALGVVIGVPLALAGTRLIASLLFGVRADDPMTISVSSFAMLAVALLAGYIPARRATKLDPLVALRDD
jgi:ABC-type antimicrobial peptide transport system permease subunit